VHSSDTERRLAAVNDFYRVRNQAVLKEIIARFSGKSTELLSYEEVRRKLRAYKGVEQGLKEIPWMQSSVVLGDIQISPGIFYPGIMSIEIVGPASRSLTKDSSDCPPLRYISSVMYILWLMAITASP